MFAGKGEGVRYVGEFREPGDGWRVVGEAEGSALRGKSGMLRCRGRALFCCGCFIGVLRVCGIMPCARAARMMQRVYTLLPRKVRGQ